MYANATKGSNEPRKDFPIKLNLVLLNSSSKEPSSTISISPKVPKTGKAAEKSGTIMLNHKVSCFTNQPNRNKSITEGTLVFDDVKSNI